LYTGEGFLFNTLSVFINMERPILDRKPRFDERSRGFRAVEGIETLSFRNYTWSLKKWLNQHREGACVAFGICHELAAIPVVVDVDEEMALRIYRRAKQLDPWPGEDYDGTSVLAGMKAIQELKTPFGEQLIPEYRWAFGIEDLVRVVGRKGPAILGLNWYEGMFNIDADGYIRKTGNLAGGHCILARGVKVKYLTKGNKKDFSNVDMLNSYFILHNSWGKEWGTNGTCKISFADMDALLKEDGEAVIPITRKK
jgi:hypothetical protein